MPNRLKRMRDNNQADIDTRRVSEDVSYDADDYMSATFVVPILKPAEHKRIAKRTHFIEPECNLSKKEVASLAKNSREAGLATPIDSSNAGFKLLLKLGWQKGGLGKDRSGIVVPIKADVKVDRLGIGKVSKAAEKRRLTAEVRERERKQAEIMERKTRSEFVSTKKYEFATKRLATDLLKARRLVEELDISSGRDIRIPLWLPNDVTPDHEEDILDGENLIDDWDLLTESEQLNCCLHYLRDMHQYCVYCGEKFTDSTDMDSFCPGLSRDCHDDTEL